MSSELNLFLRQLLRRPHEVVALAPSSGDLARAMAAELPAAPGRVAEFGAGTGKLTAALFAHRVAPADLTPFELNPEFCDHLRRRFPGVRVLNASAQEVTQHCAPGLGAVVSGLPLLSMASALQTAILGGALRAMRRSGVFLQFTYGPAPPVAKPVRETLGLRFMRSRRVWNTCPPRASFPSGRTVDFPPPRR